VNAPAKLRQQSVPEHHVPQAVLASPADEAPDYLLEPGYINRRMLIEALGISVSEFRSLSARGLVKGAKRNARGWWLYREDSIEKLKKHVIIFQTQRAEAARSSPSVKLLPATKEPNVAYSTEDAHAVFNLLIEGKNLVDIFIQTKIHPAIINVILKDYERMAGCLFVNKPIVDGLNELSLPGTEPIKTADQLFEAVKNAAALLAEKSRCKTCKAHSRMHCGNCVEDAVKVALAKAAEAAKPAG